MDAVMEARMARMQELVRVVREVRNRYTVDARQPLDGSAGKQITNFKTGSISDFRWSPDGKTLGLVRVNTQSDIVLLRDRTNP